MTFHSITSQVYSIFQLTSSQGGWRKKSKIKNKPITFQLTSSQGGWHDPARIRWEVRDISTHILTRRMTLEFTQMLIESDISTHILTRRMTNSEIFRKYLQKFQLTSSQGGWPLPFITEQLSFRHFNSHPHKEDDKDLYLFWWNQNISTHILTRRMTVSLWNRHTLSVFQLTSSQGGWPIASLNSVSLSVFQLTSSQGGWQGFIFILMESEYFNSHPHKEDDLLVE